MPGFIGNNPAFGINSSTTYTFISSANQTLYYGPDYNGCALTYVPGKEQVYYNGVLLSRNLDYTANDGINITLLKNASVNSVLTVLSYTPINVATTYNNQQIDTYFAPKEALAFNNIVINGGMEISQEKGANIVYMINTNGYVVDQWSGITVQASANIAFQQVTPPGSPSFGSSYPYCLQAKAIVANSYSGSGDYFSFAQLVEGIRWAKLGWGSTNAQPLTIGFWAYSTVSGNTVLSTRNLATTRSYVTPITINSPTTWEWKCITIPGETSGAWNSNNSIACQLWIGTYSGSTFQTSSANTWLSGNYISLNNTNNLMGTANNVLCITGVVAIPGTHSIPASKAPFYMRSADVELPLCQRYFYSLIFPNSSLYFYTIDAGSGHYKRYIYTWPVQMRIAPQITATISVYNGSFAGGSPNISSYISTTCAHLTGDTTTDAALAYISSANSFFVNARM